MTDNYEDLEGVSFVLETDIRSGISTTAYAKFEEMVGPAGNPWRRYIIRHADLPFCVFGRSRTQAAAELYARLQDLQEV